jgi:hypothetical protein
MGAGLDVAQTTTSAWGSRGELLPSPGRAAPRRERPGLLERPVHDVDRARPAPDQEVVEDRGDVSRADDQERALVDVFVDLARELHRHARNRRRAGTHARLGAHALARRARLLEEAVEHRPRGSRGGRHAQRFADLGEDLVFADDEGFESGRDPEEVTDRVGAREPVAASEDVGLGKAVESGDELGDGLLDVGRGAHAVDLAPVARRDDDPFRQHALPRDVGERLPDAVRGERHALAEGNRRPAEIPAHQDERRLCRRGHRNTCSVEKNRLTTV